MQQPKHLGPPGAPKASSKKKASPTSPPHPRLFRLDFLHLLQLPRELRDLVWEQSLLAAHPPPAIPSPVDIAAAYRQYDSWGEEAIHYPRTTRINSTALLCCQPPDPRRGGAPPLSACAPSAASPAPCACCCATRSTSSSTGSACPPSPPTTTPSHISFKIVGKPQPKHSPTTSTSLSTPVKTLHPSSSPAHHLPPPLRTLLPHHHAPSLLLSSSSSSSSSSSASSSLIYARQAGVSTTPSTAPSSSSSPRLRTHGPRFLGDPIIFSAISSSPSSPPRRHHAPTTFTALCFDVLTPPAAHAAAYRPAMMPPLVVAVALREFAVWAVHGASTAMGGVGRVAENAFFVGGFGEVCVLLDGEEIGVEDVLGAVRARGVLLDKVNARMPGGMAGTARRRWWAPVWGDGVVAERGCGGEGGLHRYCEETRVLRRALA
ncbi:hypothetical protein GTA08_BOTSDO10364 [Botryosphaeria dothidea]|uniref:Uncharacterized protein n=1 Tax=Botryosphaeria dothidea TaxID=55169 RepID=A0A8H4IL97_9PEZI|nr:hypothetical protein GTA08_BOTSDO10364 [Botryosphaeria dothidea]